MTLHQRNLHPNDLPHLPALLAALDREPRAWNAAFLERKIYGDLDYDPVLSPLIEAEGRPVALAHGVIRRDAAQAEPVAYLKLMAVEPAYQRQGLMGRLLDTFQVRVKGAGVRQIKITYSPPAYFLPGVEVGYAGAINLLLRRGYESSRTSHVNMNVDLDPAVLDTRAAEARLAQQGYLVRRATAQDRQAAVELGDRLGGWGWRSEVDDAFSHDPVRLHVVAGPDGALVAFAAQDVVGPGLFGPTGTDAGLRRLGLGTVLLKRCLKDVLDQGYSRAEIAGAGPIAYYINAVGARISRVFWPFTKTLT